MSFKDCDYRFYVAGDYFVCKNKPVEDNKCDNCKGNVHLNCTNYNPSKDFCLKFFKGEISSMRECQEKTTFNDKELSRKWSN